MLSPGNPVRGTVALTSNTSDGGSGISTVAYELAPNGGSFNTQPASWDTTLGADGLYDLRVITTDVAGNSTTSPLITTRVDNTPPALTFSSPATGDTVSGTVALTASASDASPASTARQLRLQAPQRPAERVHRHRRLVEHDDTPRGDGLYDVRARATDDANNTTTVENTSIRVDNVAPTVAITAPAAAINGSLPSPTSFSAHGERPRRQRRRRGAVLRVLEPEQRLLDRHLEPARHRRGPRPVQRLLDDPRRGRQPRSRGGRDRQRRPSVERHPQRRRRPHRAADDHRRQAGRPVQCRQPGLHVQLVGVRLHVRVPHRRRRLGSLHEPAQRQRPDRQRPHLRRPRDRRRRQHRRVAGHAGRGTATRTARRRRSTTPARTSARRSRSPRQRAIRRRAATPPASPRSRSSTPRTARRGRRSGRTTVRRSTTSSGTRQASPTASTSCASSCTTSPATAPLRAGHERPDRQHCRRRRARTTRASTCARRRRSRARLRTPARASTTSTSSARRPAAARGRRSRPTRRPGDGFQVELRHDGVADGHYDFRTVAYDVAGNQAAATPVTDRLVDNTAPNATLNDPGAYLRGAVSLDARARATRAARTRPASSASRTSTPRTAAAPGSPTGSTFDSTVGRRRQRRPARRRDRRSRQHDRFARRVTEARRQHEAEHDATTPPAAGMRAPSP